MGKSRGGARCSGPGCARKMEENCRRQVFGARSGARNERRVLFFIGSQRERLGRLVLDQN